MITRDIVYDPSLGKSGKPLLSSETRGSGNTVTMCQETNANLVLLFTLYAESVYDFSVVVHGAQHFPHFHTPTLLLGAYRNIHFYVTVAVVPCSFFSHCTSMHYVVYRCSSRRLVSSGSSTLALRKCRVWFMIVQIIGVLWYFLVLHVLREHIS